MIVKGVIHHTLQMLHNRDKGEPWRRPTVAGKSTPIWLFRSSEPNSPKKTFLNIEFPHHVSQFLVLDFIKSLLKFIEVIVEILAML